MRRSRSPILRAMDAEIEAEIERQVARNDAMRSKVQARLEQYRLAGEARRLAGDTSFLDFPIETVAAILKAAHRAATARTQSERRQAKIEELSLRGMSVRQIADEVGLTYHYVVQVRRKLGVSRPRAKQ